MLAIFFGVLAFGLAVALVLVVRQYNSASNACTCHSFEKHSLSPLALLDHTPLKPRYASRWSDSTIVQFSKRYRTLRDDEV